MQKLYFCDCEKVFFALRRKYWKNRASHCYKKKFQADPECKNYIFAIAKKYFSHSGEHIGKTGHLIATKKSSRRIRSAKIIFLRLRKSIFRTPEKILEKQGISLLQKCRPDGTIQRSLTVWRCPGSQVRLCRSGVPNLQFGNAVWQCSGFQVRALRSGVPNLQFGRIFQFLSDIGNNAKLQVWHSGQFFC
ncbi:Uncharacterized protein dnm_033590 [Desulfonema magnum]|uniref:Uncharacterized protein n=1 Tax=Desulfonema magnum TaxID=45655 RepID=A0A975GN28_9BACT|nr:Uncharacterized protein dnm_033590 [Desulfonema magnum]